MTKLKTSEIRHIIICPTIVRVAIYQQFPKVNALYYNILVSSELVLNTYIIVIDSTKTLDVKQSSIRGII